MKERLVMDRLVCRDYASRQKHVHERREVCVATADGNPEIIHFRP